MKNAPANTSPLTTPRPTVGQTITVYGRHEATIVKV